MKTKKSTFPEFTGSPDKYYNANGSIRFNSEDLWLDEDLVESIALDLENAVEDDYSEEF